MIINTDTKIAYLGDGLTTAFPIPFKFIEPADVKLTVYDQATEEETEITSDYYVDTAASVLYYPGYPPGQEKAEAERPPALTEGKKLTIYRVTPVTQLIDMGEKYPLPTIEKMSDKLCLILQEHEELLERCIKTSMGSGITLDSNSIAQVFSSAEQAAESAALAGNSAEESKRLSEEIFDFFDDLKNNIKTMFEYDENSDIQLVKDILNASDDCWEIDENNDVMPK